MRDRLASLRPRLLSRVAIVGLLASVASGCGSDSMRFVQNPFSDPFKSQGHDEVATGSLGGSAPVSGYDSGQGGYAPPAQVASAPLAAPISAPRSTAPAEAVVGSATGWTAQGGTPFVVGSGDTLAAISGRYNVPVSALVAANGLKGSSVAPGQQITIPVYNPSAAPTVARQVAAAPVQQVSQSLTAQRNQVQSTVSNGRAAVGNLAAQPQRQVAALDQSARTQISKVQPPAAPRLTTATVTKPATQAVDAAKTQVLTPPPAKTTAKPSAPETKPAQQATPVAAAKPAAAQPQPEKPAAPQQVAVAHPTEPETTASIPKASASANEFRWPARGRVIQGFGGRGGNEGINIAVPEGTPVKAAEGGTVAYSGNELKGYGNLVLIRHEDGWVSAYANNGELLVKRGEKVKRGQTIAKSGQTGNVSSPQLHFELRKGSTPVDPMNHLAGL
ncbi:MULTISPECIES: peptidoglycan DD-metalloendopeptidase family protein [unclassified Chelatococcus]|uniref:peptidoglycan DD-metalloendopeptidase family protein n=1 Tax=unclassified Chelatococcus TaxID=2638111 RepID=UPI0020BF1371|nr:MULTISPECIES: peptidoglycan DD-metalloendopeptidase family protein [unclassified Chelatococcus]MCO5077369.1 peptidoglycan DD-metalloendopeptidase family protein [Chelatococcus sp.]CAH1670030.1 Murein DD-endopeptidase MepM/ murein hydrolase activator NlpD [Hyphomicrobiales bacterium]CAH1677737.1 Murein DD-endopeptidase MepM/ murein hydrolase activator NlpD [Hyphomicrobiales bacterium]